MKSLKLIILLLLFCTTLLRAQDPAKDFERVNKAYEEVNGVEMEVHYNVYETHSAVVSIDSQSGTYKKRGKDYYNSLMGVETLVENGTMITIDNKSKRMVLSPAHELRVADIGGMDMAKLLKNYEKIEFVKKDENTKGYIVYTKMENNRLDKFEFYFDVRTYLLEKLVLYYGRSIDLSTDGSGDEKKPRLEIIYSNVKVNPLFTDKEFAISTYVTIGKKPSVTPKYKNYQLVQSKI